MLNFRKTSLVVVGLSTLLLISGCGKRQENSDSRQLSTSPDHSVFSQGSGTQTTTLNPTTREAILGSYLAELTVDGIRAHVNLGISEAVIDGKSYAKLTLTSITSELGSFSQAHWLSLTTSIPNWSTMAVTHSFRSDSRAFPILGSDLIIAFNLSLAYRGGTQFAPEFSSASILDCTLSSGRVCSSSVADVSLRILQKN